MFTLRKLPFEAQQVASFISQETLDYHHGKHHAAYVNNLNNLTKEGEFSASSLWDIIQKSQGGIFNNAAQVFNHDFYWDCIATAPQEIPEKLKLALKAGFGSVEAFKEAYLKAATTLFGSGWAWLVLDLEGKLEIVQTQNAATPITSGKIPLLVCDVWEHAYYVDFRNARPGYLDKFWESINWDFVTKNYELGLHEGIESTKRYVAALHA